MRHDIQFLRGIAVLAVVLYHAKILPMPGGYLGVDIFFVISGFLITSIILRDLDNGSFSFKQFYTRRAKRLLPAAYSTLIFTTLLSYQFLTRSQWNDYIWQLFGAITFTANLILPFQTGYFEAAAEGKPLLHIWSLSLEEQYYLLMPLLLFFLKKKWRGWFLSASILLSLLLCFILVSIQYTYWRLPAIDSTMMAFFTLPTRAWELLTGSLVAWLMLRSPLLNISHKVKLPIFTVIVIVLIFPADNIHPRTDALIVVFATALLLIGNDKWLPLNFVTRAIEKRGDWSYSLYLIHWPLFAFAYNAYLGVVPTYTMWFLVFLSLVLAYLQYQFVEQHFRYGWQGSINSKRTFRRLIGSSVLVILLPIPAIVTGQMQSRSGTIDFQHIRRSNIGLSKTCSQGKVFVQPGSSCMTSDKPEIALWGDSYMMHLVPGLKIDPTLGSSLVQITKAACAPIRGIASLDSNYDESWAKTCLAFNEKAFQYIQNIKSIKFVILSSPFSGYFDNEQQKLFVEGKKIIGSRALAIELMVQTIVALQRAGKQPIIISPPPKSGFNIGECLEREATGVLVLGQPDCNIQVVDYHSFQKGVIEALEEIGQRTGIDIVWLNEITCNAEVCITKVGDTYIYKDAGHLTVAGSEWLIPQLRLAGRFLKNMETISLNPESLVQE
ncbi:MAG: hypothetical protein DRQ62_10675 [Gammaproteobacteria bacterium]|nr:MAG: hypothetical protein DRQ62_10675 [Gammaproteobacteria bacterium]